MSSNEFPLLATPCNDCLDDPEQVGAVGSVLACYCRHNKAGSFIQTDENSEGSKTWHTFSPIEENVFVATLSGILKEYGEVPLDSPEPELNKLH